MKLIVQMPCYNEESSLPITVAALPRHLAGVDVIEYLVIAAGSTDHTAQVARALGVQHVVSLPHPVLARPFMPGLGARVRAAADILVDTDVATPTWQHSIGWLEVPVPAGTADIA